MINKDVNDIKCEKILLWIIGILLGVKLILDVLIAIYPEKTHATKKLLNSGRYTIDTTMLVHKSDTTYYYKFIEIE